MFLQIGGNGNNSESYAPVDIAVFTFTEKCSSGWQNSYQCYLGMNAAAFLELSNLTMLDISTTILLNNLPWKISTGCVVKVWKQLPKSFTTTFKYKCTNERLMDRKRELKK
jgi:hypothetical protein